MKLVRCRDHGFDCPYEVAGTEQDVLEQAAKHAHHDHGLEVNEDLANLVKDKWLEVEAPKV